MIRNREKLKLAMWLLLIVRNGAFAELKCYIGVQVDGKDGYNEKAVPESVVCPSGDTCLRVEADEASVGGNKGQLSFFKRPSKLFTSLFQRKLRVNVSLQCKLANLFWKFIHFHMLKIKSE